MHAAHILMPKSIAQSIPREIYDDEEEKVIAYVKYFHPFSSWTWYVTAYNGKDLCYGLVFGLEVEWGTFPLSTLRKIKIEGLKIERDLWFQPKTISEIKKLHGIV